MYGISIFSKLYIIGSIIHITFLFQTNDTLPQAASVHNNGHQENIHTINPTLQNLQNGDNLRSFSSYTLRRASAIATSQVQAIANGNFSGLRRFDQFAR